MNWKPIFAFGAAWIALLLAGILITGLASGRSAQAPGVPETTYEWHPQLAPEGPVTVVVRVPQQTAYVYRNGVRIGVSKVSTGRPGYETPLGVFTVLEKQREHFSNLYDDAPMPYMQRLTWSGVALHAGSVPGYPASHGCIRLPHEFAERLFGITAKGTTVIVSGTAPPYVTTARLPFESDPVGVSTRESQRGPADSAEGPVTVVMSIADREVVVLRNGVEIGRAPATAAEGLWHGTRAYLRLQGEQSRPSAVLPDRPALKWLEIALEPDAPASVSLDALVQGLDVDPDFAGWVYDLLTPGSTLIVTDEPISTGPDATLILAETPAH